MPTDETPSAPARDALQNAEQLVSAAGAHARPLREIIALLTEGPHTLASLVRLSAVSRRGVEAVLEAVGPDLITGEDGIRLRPDRAESYRERFGYQQLRRVRLADPLAPALERHRSTIDEMDRLIAAAPRGRQALDHVSATAETVVRRALWLDATFDLSGAQLLCAGDHDLTSLAVAQVNTGVAITVVDVDERILEFIDEQARRRGLNIRCLFADFRFGFPSAAKESADLLITDPPYTPEGVALFLSRGLASLRDRELGRLVLAYGFGERQPTLGLKVQRAIQELHLVYEAILPDFNSYAGAQAVGSASDLYVCRPTSRTWKAFDAPARSSAPNIYTHGAQSLEGANAALDEPTIEALRTAATGEQDLPLAVLADGWQPSFGNIGHVRLGTLMSSGLPAAITRQPSFAVAADLSADPGPWLLRVLLAVNAERVVLLVPGEHPDVAGETARRELGDLIADKYALRFRRNEPDSRYALVEAALVGAPSARLTRQLLDRAHGKIGNVWRDGLVRFSRDSARGPMTKNAARERIQLTARRPDLLDATLIELPRGRIRELCEEAAASLENREPSQP
ncbi:bis-aminopropyl spermidine synthase family protein [Saccharopolyspora sp.]|uniref:bis-aminopropyl spermidine synthase family protein n=1 Tax=Saccharopolyspora sp. TaxID=33915 RepID=UPI0025D11943|nr:bis-aminopropyl spermidine synthase family protein [Saccharopolyspora sp.]